MGLLTHLTFHLTTLLQHLKFAFCFARFFLGCSRLFQSLPVNLLTLLGFTKCLVQSVWAVQGLFTEQIDIYQYKAIGIDVLRDIAIGLQAGRFTYCWNQLSVNLLPFAFATLTSVKIEANVAHLGLGTPGKGHGVTIAFATERSHSNRYSRWNGFHTGLVVSLDVRILSHNNVGKTAATGCVFCSVTAG